MITPGEIYWADLATGRRPVVVVSREDLNRGNYVVAVLCTTVNFAVRSTLPNCVPFRAGEFGLPQGCVAQCEAITFVQKQNLDLQAGGYWDFRRWTNARDHSRPWARLRLGLRAEITFAMDAMARRTARSSVPTEGCAIG